jgi:hypothetical protein
LVVFVPNPLEAKWLLLWKVQVMPRKNPMKVTIILKRAVKAWTVIFMLA